MDLEISVLSEVRERNIIQYCLYVDSGTIKINLFAKQNHRYRNRLVVTRKGKGINPEIGSGIHILL